MNDDSNITSAAQEEGAPIVINDEESLWRAVEIYASGKYRKNQTLIIQNWAKGDLYLKGEQYNGKISYSAMRHLCDLQTRIYQSFALAKYGTKNANRLKQNEKDALEIFANVDEGSSDINGYSEEIILNFAKILTDKMTPEQIFLALIFFIVLFFGERAYRAWVNKSIEERRIELEEKSDERDAAERKQMLDMLNYRDDLDLQRYEMLSQIASRNVIPAQIMSEAEKHFTERLKLASRVSSLSIGDVTVSASLASELLKKKRQEKLPIQLNDEYSISKTNHTQPDGHILNLTSIKTKQSFNAFLPNLFAQGENQEYLNRAYLKQPIGINVIGYIKNGEIIDAQITGFYEINNDES